MSDITTSPAWAKLLEHAERASKGDYRNAEKLQWVQELANHYEERTGIDAIEIFEAWEKRRSYWFMNFYQDANQPLIDEKVRVFDDSEAFLQSIGDKGFRCPACGAVSKNPYQCDAGTVTDGKVCDWKAYGLFGTMGKGSHAVLRRGPEGNLVQAGIFKPIAWEVAA